MNSEDRRNNALLALFPFVNWFIGIWCFAVAVIPLGVYASLGTSPWWSPALVFGVSGILVLLLAVYGGLLSLSQETSPALYSFLPLFFSCVAPFLTYVLCFSGQSADVKLLRVMGYLSVIISLIPGASVMTFIARDLPPLVAFLMGHPTPKRRLLQRLSDYLKGWFVFRNNPERLLWIVGFAILITLIYYDERFAKIPCLVLVPLGYLALLIRIRYPKERRGYFLSSFLWVYLLLAFFVFLGWGLGVWLSAYNFDLAFFPYIGGYLLLWSYDQGDRRLKEIMEGPSTPSGLPTDLSEDCREGLDLGSRR